MARSYQCRASRVAPVLKIGRLHSLCMSVAFSQKVLVGDSTGTIARGKSIAHPRSDDLMNMSTKLRREWIERLIERAMVDGDIDVLGEPCDGPKHLRQGGASLERHRQAIRRVEERRERPADPHVLLQHHWVPMHPLRYRVEDLCAVSGFQSQKVVTQGRALPRARAAETRRSSNRA